LVQPQHVDRAEHDARGGEHGPVLVGHTEGTDEDREFTNEPVPGDYRHADRRQHHDHEEHGEHGHHTPQAAELRNLTRVPALVNHPYEQEQCTRGQPMVDHLQHAAGQPLCIEREDADHRKPEMTDRRIRNELLPVRLDQRDHRTVDHPDDRQPQRPREEFLRRIGKHRQAEPEEPVGPHLEQHPRQNHRSGGGRLDVRVG